MWSYDSAKHRDLRVPLVVNRTMREGLGSEEDDLRPDLLDFAVVVSPVLPDAWCCEEALDPSMIYDVLSDGDGSAMMTADLSEHLSAASVINDAPEMRVVDSEELNEIAEGSDVALSSPCLKVSVPSSSRFAGLLGAASEDRGYRAVMGLSPVVSAHSDSGGGQATGDGVASEITGGLGEFLVADTGVDSVIPVPSLSSVSPSLLAVVAGDEAPLLSICDGVMVEGGLVSEEGLVSLAAREALRPPPIDGRRQPPLSAVEPAIVAGRGWLMPVAGGGPPFGGGGMDTVGREGGDGRGV
ncbi:hypothetical protein Dimus_030401 [Dionaea muscipula]